MQGMSVCSLDPCASLTVAAMLAPVKIVSSDEMEAVAASPTSARCSVLLTGQGWKLHPFAGRVVRMMSFACGVIRQARANTKVRVVQCTCLACLAA